MADEPSLDRSAFSVTSLQNQDEEEREYWARLNPTERIRALERSRQIVYGYDPASTRLQRVLEIAERS